MSKDNTFKQTDAQQLYTRQEIYDKLIAMNYTRDADMAELCWIYLQEAFKKGWDEAIEKSSKINN
jgi:hypothetical protein